MQLRRFKLGRETPSHHIRRMPKTCNQPKLGRHSKVSNRYIQSLVDFRQWSKLMGKPLRIYDLLGALGINLHD